MNLTTFSVTVIIENATAIKHLLAFFEKEKNISLLQKMFLQFGPFARRFSQI